MLLYLHVYTSKRWLMQGLGERVCIHEICISPYIH